MLLTRKNLVARSGPREFLTHHVKPLFTLSARKMPGPDVARTLRHHAFPGTTEIVSVIEKIPPDARFVLIGEASHGTHEFYQNRADITKLLIEQRGFHAVVTEAGNIQQFTKGCQSPKKLEKRHNLNQTCSRTQR